MQDQQLLFLCFGSGSSGNSYYLGTRREGILIDAGVSARTIHRHLRGLELDFSNILVSGDGFNHKCISSETFGAAASPLEVQKIVSKAQKVIADELEGVALDALQLPAETRTDLILPATSLGQNVQWTSSNEAVISASGVLTSQKADTDVTLTATIGSKERQFEVKVLARDITANVRYEQTETLDLTANTATGFSTNKYGLAPDQDDRLGGELSHIIVMQHVTKERLQNFLNDLAKCK